MEASHGEQLKLNPQTPSGRRSSRQARLIDPAAIDYGSTHGHARLALMLGPVFDRLTAVEIPRGSDA